VPSFRLPHHEDGSALGLPIIQFDQALMRSWDEMSYYDGGIPDYFLQHPRLRTWMAKFWRIGRLSTPKTKTLIATAQPSKRPVNWRLRQGHQPASITTE
jgi:hypothetical protein